MAFTGAAEVTAINTILDGLTEPYFEGGVPDDYELPKDWSNTIAPFRVVAYGTPVARARGRGLGVSEQGQPYTLGFTVINVAGTAAGARLLSQATNTALVGVIPNAPNSGAIKAEGGHTFQIMDTEQKPSQWRVINYYALFVNATVDELS